MRRVKSQFNLFGEFFKVEKSDDGTIYVEGYASSGARDADGEVVLPDAMREALPAYMKFGTVREQHDPMKAAGTAVFAEVQEDGRTRFGAKIVDPITIKKVEHKVLKGFSIRGKALRRSKSDPFTIEKLRLTSIDIVDRGSNPDAIVDLIKFDDGIEKAGAPLDRKILKRVVAGWRVALGPDDVAKADASMQERLAAKVGLKKGLYSLGDFACCLSSLESLLLSRTWEEDAENDDAGKALNSRLASAIDSLGQLLLEMTTEELSELHPAYRTEATMKTETAGTTTPAVTKAADAPAAPANPLGDMLVKSLREAIAADPTIVEKLGLSAKPLTPEDRISKLESTVSELTDSNNALVEALTKALGGRAPAPRKGVTKAVPVEKADDVTKVDDPDGGGEDDKDPVKGYFNKAFSNPRVIAFPGIGA